MWLRAERQTAGRGRLGRAWQSPPGNLHASTIVRLRTGDPPPATLALLAGVALHEVSAAWAPGSDLRLKWPNDLLAGSAKLAGILLERSGDAIVLGFGVDLAHAPESLDRSTTSFAALTRAAPDPATFLDDLRSAVARWLQCWRAQGFAAVRTAWLAAAFPIGTALISNGEQGLFDGLDPDGALRLRRPEGGLSLIRAGDVFLL